MSLFFYFFFTFAIICDAGNSSQHQTSLQCLSAINMVLSAEDKILIKSLCLKGTDEFPKKSWTKRGVNKLLKKLRDIELPNTTTQQPTLFTASHMLSKKITMPSYA